MTHLQIGGTIGGSPVAFCGTRGKKNPLQFYKEGDPAWQTWDGSFLIGPTCSKCWSKQKSLQINAAQ